MSRPPLRVFPAMTAVEAEGFDSAACHCEERSDVAIRSFRTARRSFTAFRMTAKRYACHTERGEGSCDKGMGNDPYAFPFGEGGFGGKCLHFASKTDEVFTRSAPRLCRYTGAKPSTKDLIRHLLRKCRLPRAFGPVRRGPAGPFDGGLPARSR